MSTDRNKRGRFAPGNKVRRKWRDRRHSEDLQQLLAELDTLAGLVDETPELQQRIVTAAEALRRLGTDKRTLQAVQRTCSEIEARYADE